MKATHFLLKYLALCHFLAAGVVVKGRQSKGSVAIASMIVTDTMSMPVLFCFVLFYYH